jgi:crotonobetainyl-CoA:carnitine CoA-transferase CaiB-like acyl-CoA transferase
MERFGLGYERLKEIKRDIIVVCMSAYGATGPESSYAGYGGAIEAISGVQSLTAYERGGDRMRVREVDVTNGIMGACAVMTALVERALGGGGQFIDLSQREASTWLIGEHLLEHAVNGRETLPTGNRHPRFAPQGCYPCAGEDRWVVITVRSQADWTALCAQMGATEWAEDPSIADAEGRRARHDEIDERIAAWTMTQDAAVVVRALQACGIAAGVVADVSQLAADPHLEARGWFAPAPGSEENRYPGFPFRFRRSEGGVLRRRGPDLGADNQRILVDELGMDPRQLPSLAKEDLGTSFDLE